jgi:hypothetical protein
MLVVGLAPEEPGTHHRRREDDALDGKHVREDGCHDAVQQLYHGRAQSDDSRAPRVAAS